MLYNLLKYILNKKPLLFINIIINNKNFLNINNVLNNIKINSYLFINIIFIKKVLTYFKILIIIGF